MMCVLCGSGVARIFGGGFEALVWFIQFGQCTLRPSRFRQVILGILGQRANANVSNPPIESQRQATMHRTHEVYLEGPKCRSYFHAIMLLKCFAMPQKRLQKKRNAHAGGGLMRKLVPRGEIGEQGGICSSCRKSINTGGKSKN